jgi:hypothetical protein
MYECEERYTFSNVVAHLSRLHRGERRDIGTANVRISIAERKYYQLTASGCADPANGVSKWH